MSARCYIAKLGVYSGYQDVSQQRYTISILLQNEAGALARVAGLFSSRGYNIESLHVAPTDDHVVSRLTLVTVGDEPVIRQICSQLLKLVDVVDLFNMAGDEFFERELMLIKLRLSLADVGALDDCIQTVGAKVLDDNNEAYTLEVTGPGPRLDQFMQDITAFGEILTVVRSGAMAMRSGAASLGNEQAVA